MIRIPVWNTDPDPEGLEPYSNSEKSIKNEPTVLYRRALFFTSEADPDTVGSGPFPADLDNFRRIRILLW